MKYTFGKTIVDKHEHSFDSIKLTRVIPDNPRYSIGKNGSWSFIVRYCKCGAESTMDFLHKEDAEERLDLIMERG